jgi:aspartate/methionine/tyrosine aminotransferase
MRIPDFQLERYFARHEFTARLLLCSSDCETLSVEELLAMSPGADRELARLRLGYTESPGHPDLRRAIGGLYSGAGVEDVLTVAGAEEGIFIVMNVLLEKGDHVIAHHPGYQSLSEVARAIGCEISAWEADAGRGWELDPDELRALLRPNTRLVVLNCPHNPTGYLMSREKFEAVVGMVRERGVHLFSDEVYRGLEYDPRDRLPAACDRYERAVSLGVMSKTYGLAGLRVGWVVTHDRELLSRAAAFKDYTTICSSAPSEFLATVALRSGPRLIERNLGIIAANLKVLDRFFAERRALVEWVRPRAGSVAFPRLVAGTGSERFCEELVREKGVLLMPSARFGYGDAHFRIGFGRRNMPEALAVLDEYLRTRTP